MGFFDQLLKVADKLTPGGFLDPSHLISNEAHMGGVTAGALGSLFGGDSNWLGGLFNDIRDRGKQDEANPGDALKKAAITLAAIYGGGALAGGFGGAAGGAGAGAGAGAAEGAAALTGWDAAMADLAAAGGIGEGGGALAGYGGAAGAGLSSADLAALYDSAGYGSGMSGAATGAFDSALGVTGSPQLASYWSQVSPYLQKLSGAKSNSWVNAARTANGLYGFLESRRLQKSMRPPKAGELERTPGYQAGLEAVQRSLAAQGYQGSGNMMAALQRYGENAYALESQRRIASGQAQAGGLYGQMSSLGLLASGLGGFGG